MKEFYLKLNELVVKLIFASLFLAVSCITPVEPQFEFRDNILFVDAYALTEEGASSVSIRKSVLINERFYTEGIINANVQFINTSTGEEVICTELSDGLYIPPSDFKAQAGEIWKLFIGLEDGRRYESTAETVGKGVEVDNITATYSDEVTFLETEGKFVPGHSVAIDWADPAGEQNFYLWKYKTYEPLFVCKTCERGRFRNGECSREDNFRFRNFDYLCATECWLIRYGNNFQIFEDELVDGKTITDRPIAIIPFYRKQDILVEIQQLSLSESSYEYYSIINDILVKNSGLNAPPPAALSGNLINIDDSKEAVLGQFIATSSSTLTLFIDRSEITAAPIVSESIPALEDTTNPDHIIIAPCVEERERTSIKPMGWK